MQYIYGFKVEMVLILLLCSVWFLYGVIFLQLKEALQNLVRCLALRSAVAYLVFKICIHSLGIEFCGNFVPIFFFCLFVFVCVF